MDDLDDDRFSPLTESELVRGSGCGGAPPHNGWKAIVPIPDGVRLPDLLVKKCCPSGYSIRSAWRYRTPTGGVSGFVVRYDEPGTDRKEFKQFTYCESAAGKREWRCRGMPEPRPLFNLDLLAANPDAPVLVSEGEKSAARAARIFPKSVCITSPGGCKAWRQADWSPLAGRKVLIWPDCDEPGEEYNGEVAHIIHGLGCSVSVVDAVALASLAPNGGQREPEKGWDAADAVADWRDMAALRKAAHGLAKPYEPGPQFVSWGDFTMDSGGLTTEVAKGRGENATTETIWIASAFEVIGACRDPYGRGWGKWLRWRDADGRIHTRHVSDAALQGDPSVLCGGLADEGLSINRNQQRRFLTYLSGCNVKGRVTIVHRTGWHEIGNHQIFVPERFLDAWAHLQVQKPHQVSDDGWRQAIDDAGQFFDQWGSLAADFGWTPGDRVRGFGPEHAVLWGGERVLDKLTRGEWINPYMTLSSADSSSTEPKKSFQTSTTLRRAAVLAAERRG